MEIKFFKDLNSNELQKFYKSDLFIEYNNYWNLTDNNILYQIEYYKNEFEDYRLVIFDSKSYYLIAFFFKKIKEISFFNRPAIIITNPYYYDNESLYNILFKKIQQLCDNNIIEKIKILDNNYFLSKYYNCIKPQFDTYKIYIDLLQTEEFIKKNIRKSYKSLINWGAKNLIVVKYDHSNINTEIFDSFKKFHISVSNKQTRSDETWNLQFQTILNKNGFLYLAYYQNLLVSGIYIIHGFKDAYYGIAVNDRDLMSKNIPVGHYLLYKSIIECKLLNLEIFELGNLGISELNKINLINNFKKGFTNTLSPCYNFEIDLNEYK